MKARCSLTVQYRPYLERTPDIQYQDLLRRVRTEGIYTKNEFQTNGTYTSVTLPKMVFPLSNGVPLITERRCGFWRKPIAEIIGFINGARTLDQLRQYGGEKTWASWWATWVTAQKCADFGLEEGDLGPGSYGAAFHDFPMPDGSTFNQWEHLIREIHDFPWLRTHKITAWIPYYALQHKGLKRKVVVAPCHGDVQVTILDKKLYLQMDQRSCDTIVGLPSNLIQYAAITLMVAQVTGYEAHTYVHNVRDGQVYENQLDWCDELLNRPPKAFPTLRITDSTIKDLFAFRPEHFELTDYDAHPAMNDIPVTT